MSKAGGAVRARRDRFDEYRLKLVDGYAERLVTGMSTAQAGSTRSLRGSRLVGSLVVLPVHLVTAASLVGGLYLLLWPHTWPERLAGALLLLVCYGTRPEIPKRPPYVARLKPETAPATFALLEQVGDQVGAPVPDEVLISRKFNASVSRAGLRGRALELGAPLWVAAGPQARIALLAHELGHIAHRDLTSSLWVGSARHTLRKWDHVFRTPSMSTVGTTRNGAWGAGFAVLLSTLLFPLFRGVTGAYSSLVEWANAPAHRRQEMLADLDSARVAGTDGALELFDTLLASMSVETSISSAAVDARRPDLWGVVTERLAARGPEERSRARAAAASERTRIDASHPATTLRIRLVEGRPWETAALAPDEDQWAAIDAELARPLAAAAKAIGERLRYRR
ncbi:MAG: M48 family metalloprotease [Nocardioides sp.]